MNVINYILLSLIIIFIFKDIDTIKKFFISKKYRKIYNDIFKNDSETMIQEIEDYLKIEKSRTLKAKATLLLIYEKLMSNQDISEDISKFNANLIFLKNNNYNKDYAINCSDMFFWLCACLPRLKEKNYLDEINEKISSLDKKYENHVEYKVYKSAYAILKNEPIENYDFLNKFVNGEYVDLYYDKHLVVSFKRLSLAYLSSLTNDSVFEYTVELKNFSLTKVGKEIMKDLNVYEIYK